MAAENVTQRQVTDVDLVGLIVLSALAAEGFSRQDAPSQLYQIRRSTAAFIDEVQDFREVEVLLMGMVVTDKYNQITLSGDRRQQLQTTGSDDFRNLFPFVPRSNRNRPVFLDRNFRQREALQVLSAGIRSMQGESKNEEAKSAAVLHTFKTERGMAQFILERVLTVDPYATVAIILPSEPEARKWYNLLHDDLSAYHRPPLLSHRDDLTRRNDIHFMEVRETKGLEFDVVIIPDVGLFNLKGAIGCNQLYVGVSRPRHALLLGCDARYVSDRHLQKLVTGGLMKVIPILESRLN